MGRIGLERIFWLLLCLWVSGVPLVEAAAPGDGVRAILAEWREARRAQETGASPDGRAARQPKVVGGIRLVWQNFFDEDINFALQPPIPGVTVVSPCWFMIADASGRIAPAPKAAPARSYVDEAHAKGYQVWALVTNADFDPDVTGEFLQSPAGRKAAVENLIKTAEIYDLDGINLDFEDINFRDRDALTSFAEEAAAAFHRQGLILSVDVTFPGGSENWSQCYDRAALAKAADYIAVMAYDEHGQYSPVAGSVASFAWVERGLTATLEEVPPDKLLLGMPLYMRLWQEDAGHRVKARTLTMAEAQRLLAEKHLRRTWLSDAAQYYFEYTDGDHLCRVWQEDARSLAQKAALVSRYDLAGAAFWRRGHETMDVWDVIMAVMDTAH